MWNSGKGKHIYIYIHMGRVRLHIFRFKSLYYLQCTGNIVQQKLYGNWTLLFVVPWDQSHWASLATALRPGEMVTLGSSPKAFSWMDWQQDAPKTSKNLTPKFNMQDAGFWNWWQLFVETWQEWLIQNSVSHILKDTIEQSQGTCYCGQNLVLFQLMKSKFA